VSTELFQPHRDAPGSASSPVDELVGLLEKWSPSSLEAIRQKYPHQDYLLKPGRILGDGTADTQIRIEICISALGAAAAACRKTIESVQKKLKFADRSQFIGQLFTVVGGASIFGVLALDVPPFTRYAAAIVGLAGAVLTLIAQHALRSPGAKDQSLLDIYSELIDCRATSEGALRELEIARRLGAEKDVSELITKANALAERVTKLTDLVV
jgi:hypothetical protein